MFPEPATEGVLWKKGVLKNFTKFTGKHLCQSRFFNKVAELSCGYNFWNNSKTALYYIIKFG